MNGEAKKEYFDLLTDKSFNVCRCGSCGYQASNKDFICKKDERYSLGLDYFCPICHGNSIEVILIKPNTK